MTKVSQYIFPIIEKEMERTNNDALRQSLYSRNKNRRAFTSQQQRTKSNFNGFGLGLNNDKININSRFNDFHLFK